MDEQPTTEPVASDLPVVDAPPEPAPPDVPAPPPFSVLHVLATALRVTKANLVPFLVLACVLEAPGLLVQLAIGSDGAFLAMVLAMFSRSLTSAVVAYGVIMELQGSRPSTRACIAVGLSQLGRVIGVTIMSTIVICGAMLLLVVPGVIVALMFFVIMPITVVEKLGIVDAMKRSRDLTDGRKGDLFLISMFAFLVAAFVQYIALTELTPETAFVWSAIWSAVSTMYFSVTAAVVYVVLRRSREGTQPPELATAFARIRK